MDGFGIRFFRLALSLSLSLSGTSETVLPNSSHACNNIIIPLPPPSWRAAFHHTSPPARPDPPQSPRLGPSPSLSLSPVWNISPQNPSKVAIK